MNSKQYKRIKYTSNTRKSTKKLKASSICIKIKYIGKQSDAFVCVAVASLRDSDADDVINSYLTVSTILVRISVAIV